MVEVISARSHRRTRSQLVLDGFTVLFAIVAPVAIILGFRDQLAQTGNVSHWPWEEYGIFGWWEVPLSLWLAAACSALPHRQGQCGGATRPLLLVAAATTLALLYNP
ncbi:MAG TPA: hypothetical protein VIL85_11020 [Thermomicrobiales bacterium]|jgi:hypothetical protein